MNNILPRFERLDSQEKNLIKGNLFIPLKNRLNNDNSHFFTNSPTSTLTASNLKHYKLMVICIIILLLVSIFILLIIFWICMHKKKNVIEYQHPDDELEQLDISNQEGKEIPIHKQSNIYN